jgi:hypothetical protein
MKQLIQLTLKRCQASFRVTAWLIVSLGPLASAQEYTPDHPVVRKMVENGVKFIVRPNESRRDIGYDMLVGYTVLKATEEHDHPTVKAVLPKALQFARKVDEGKHEDEKFVYQVAVAAMFLSAQDPVRYRPELEQLRDFLYKIQKPAGGFNYLHGQFSRNEGDVSQSQYVALAFWSMKQGNIDIDPEPLLKLARWFMKVQQRDGGWSYQFPPDANFPPTHSLAAAGMSGTLVSGDCVGLVRIPGMKMKVDGAEEEDEEDGLVPGAFRRVAEKTEKAMAAGQDGPTTKKDVERSIGGGIRWISSHPYTRSPTTWHYYYMYSRERYESFVELLLGKREKSPQWFNDGVKMFLKSQSKDGGWGVEADADPVGEVAASCFAILYLLRNTQKAIGDLNSADSVGGYGLSNVANVGFIDGKIIDKSQVSSVDDALKLLESSSQGSTEDRMLGDRLALDSDPTKRKEQLNRFSRLLRSPDTRARRVAAKILGRGDDLDYAPDLIFALSEGEKDPQVLRIAENSLRILSRQLDSVKIPKDGPITAANRVEAERYWKSWYLSLRPDYIFIEN